MFADPQSITIDVNGFTLPRVKTGEREATYASPDGTLSMRISHQSTKNRVRRMVRIDQTSIAADPLTSVNTSQTASVYVVIDEPKFGYTDNYLIDLVGALTTWLTEANVAKVLGSES